MIRAFMVLWLAVFVPIILLILPTSFNPIQRLNESFSEQFYKQIYTVSFDILIDKLIDKPESQWQDIVRSYAKHFAYPLRLERVDNYQHNSQVIDSLMTGDTAFLFGDPMALLKRVGASEYLIYFALNESTELAVLNQAKGTLYLASEQLRTLPTALWQQDLAEKNARIPFEISLKSANELSATGRKAVERSTGEIVSYLNSAGQVELLAPVEPDVWLHVQDDMSQSTQMKLTSAIGGLFFLLISLALVLWVFPLWRDLKRLVKTANEFGKGVLSERANASRLSMVSQLSRSFNTMADNIERLIAGQRELTNAVAHDLRTPLYRLRFALEMLEDQSLSEAQKHKYHNTIHSSIDDLDHLINQNLLLSRYSRIADITQFTQCCLADDLAKEVEFFHLEHADIDVRFYCSPELRSLTLLIDKAAMMRAVKNVLANASRYAKRKIAISFSHHCGGYRIIIEDDGPGIPPHEHDNIFEPFVQLDNRERSSDKGHGLGLAIVRQIMQWHQGSVTVSGSPMGGAQFVLAWPATNKLDKPEAIVTKSDTIRP
ncbi:ATP-binding protein [Vibrio sinaloensis]|uniref:ATP-binding protein n=1 Tax=Photobacterium sp. (strain ATCC 43367) TaxID=379097 RepID=UPI002067B2ED|nr:ATP-binding protein [Vibrio sinaloensis]UPQ87174.1 ATP-binding protein [Vibrio sinaloensis]